MDESIRIAFIKIAEITMMSNPEPQPGTMIKLHTPVSEFPPSLPTPKIRLSVPDSTGAGVSGPVTHSATASGPLKLVIPNKKKVVPAQKKGLPESDLKAINNALAKLVSGPSFSGVAVCSKSADGLEPTRIEPIVQGTGGSNSRRRTKVSHTWVESVVRLYTDVSYLSIIKQPMDLSTTQAKLSNGLYATRQEFVKDIRLIVSNCILYNGSQSPLAHAAKQFEAYFHKRTSHSLARK